jgi:hypothetical protein
VHSSDATDLPTADRLRETVNALVAVRDAPVAAR